MGDIWKTMSDWWLVLFLTLSLFGILMGIMVYADAVDDGSVKLYGVIDGEDLLLYPTETTAHNLPNLRKITYGDININYTGEIPIRISGIMPRIQHDIYTSPYFENGVGYVYFKGDIEVPFGPFTVPADIKRIAKITMSIVTPVANSSEAHA